MLDIGGGLGIRYTRDEQVPEIADFVGPLVARLRERWPDPVQLVLEPGRSLVGRAGVTLYRVGVVKESGGVQLRRDRRRHVGQPAPAALRRPLRGAAREPRGRARRRRLPRRRQALRDRATC